MEDQKTKSRVLVVDDAPENIWILVEALKDEYAVMVAKNGYSCLRLAGGEHPPDAILLDVTMPGIDGYEVCRRLKADPATRNIPVLFITGQTDAGSEARGLELGAMDYITKPFQPLLVKTRVRNQIELKKHRDQLDLLVHARTAQLSLPCWPQLLLVVRCCRWFLPSFFWWFLVSLFIAAHFGYIGFHIK